MLTPRSISKHTTSVVLIDFSSYSLHYEAFLIAASIHTSFIELPYHFLSVGILYFIAPSLFSRVRTYSRTVHIGFCSVSYPHYFGFYLRTFIYVIALSN